MDTTTRNEHITRLGLPEGATDEDITKALEEENAGALDGDDEAETGPRTLIERLRSRRNELAEEAASGDRVLTLPIPGYNSELFVEFTYRPDAFDKLKKIGTKAVKSRHPRKELHAAMDTLAYAATNIYVSENGGETVEPFDPTGEPVGFDQRLAEVMDFPARNAREVVAKVFNNDLAITAMSNRVSEWMQGEDEEVDADF